LVLTGDIGTGKTTLINEILHTRDKNTLFVKIVDPCLEQYYLFLTIAQAFGFEKEYKKKEKFSSNFFSFLKTADKSGRKVLVIVDEAQLMSDRFLKEIISWSKFNLNKVLTIILAGQLEFHDVLKSGLGLAWKDHIIVHAFLEPLNKEETKSYINRRLELAGANRKIFLSPAVHEIYEYSKGTPRLINISCDQGLIAAFSKDMKVIDAPTIRQEIKHLHLPVVPSTYKEKDKKEPIFENHQVHSTRRPAPKNIAWIAVVAFTCLYIGYAFYSKNVPPTVEQAQTIDPPIKTKVIRDPAPPVLSTPPVPLTQPENVLTKTPQPIVTEIQKPADPEPIISDTPAPYPENKKSPLPVLKNDVVKDKSKNLEQFIQDVFSIEKQIQPLPEVVSPESQKKESAVTGESPEGKINEHEPVSSQDHEPDAIIDWLFEKNKKTGKE